LLITKDKSGLTARHRAANRGCLEALETLWSWDKKVQIIPHELLLNQNEEGKSFSTLVAQNGNLIILQAQWGCIKLYSNEMKEMMLLGKDPVGYTVWHKAGDGGGLKAIETLRSLAKEAEIKTDEFSLTRTWN
jgi:hypothetical protein